MKGATLWNVTVNNQAHGTVLAIPFNGHYHLQTLIERSEKIHCVNRLNKKLANEKFWYLRVEFVVYIENVWPRKIPDSNH